MIHQGRNQNVNTGGPKYELKKFQVTWFIKNKYHGRQYNRTLLS